MTARYPFVRIVAMHMLYAVLLLLAGGGVASLALGKSPRALTAASVASVLASLLGFPVALSVFLEGSTLSGHLPLPLPLGHCLLQIDSLASAFLLPVFLLSAVGGALLPARILALEESADLPVRYGRHGFFYCTLIAAMVLVLTAADAVFFLIAWEIMSLAPFFLISPQDRDSKERFATWIYLVAAHIGVLPLLLLFASLSVEAGSSAFAALYAFEGLQNAGLLFALAFIGFGLKMGLVPLHMWMPEAHASAPGHVAVLLSGVMLNLGLYGVLRVLTLLGSAPAGWAQALMAVGAVSGIVGIVLGLAQSDMKRTLAYSSAENMGIICLALGAGILAANNGATTAAALLLAGAFLHMWNHSLFKSLLFLGANAVKETTHVTASRLLGGLQKRIPFTGGCFAFGCAAIAGVPPLNGFMSELVMYLGFVFGSEATNGETALLFWVAFFLLGAIAGLALFAFTRLFGLVFLGSPRSAASLEAREPEPLLRGMLLFLAFSCLCVSLGGAWIIRALEPLLTSFTLRLSLPVPLASGDFTPGVEALRWYALCGLLLLLLFSAISLLRKRTVAANGSSGSPTWDCGYRLPSARMQYSGGSFSLSLTLLLKPLLRPLLTIPVIKGLFPTAEKAFMASPDWPTELWERLLFKPVAALADKTKELQTGLVNIYVLYIFIALMTALVWALGWS